MPRVKPEAPREAHSDRPAPADPEAHPAAAGLWEQCFSRENLAEALRRVERNAGAPGVDGMKTTELRSWLQDHWPEVRLKRQRRISGVETAGAVDAFQRIAASSLTAW
jgi:hypothetical protein